MYRYCNWCDHIRIKSNYDKVLEEIIEGKTVYKLNPHQSFQLYCYKTGKIIENSEKETCEDWLEMDYAF
jgi:hypothetical protein